MREQGAEFEERDLGKQPLDAGEIDALIGGRDHLPFLNTRNAEYRERKLKVNPPGRQTALKLMAGNPNLIRRPLLIAGEGVLFGYKEDEYRAFLAEL